MENKKGFSVLKAVITVIAILFIVVSLVVNIAFSKGKTPKIFGTHIYVVDYNPLGDNITQGAALLAKDAADTEIVKGDIVLCYPAKDPTTLQLRSIMDIIEVEGGQKKYATGISTGLESDSAITKDKIVAIATGNPESLELGKYITFTTSVKGILLQLILPCIILVIFLICKIAGSGDEEDDQDYDFYEYDEEEAEEASRKAPSHAKSGSTPLFEPSQEIQPSDELERKKMSIAENFSQKKINPNSPYQKEKERTMQFKAQRSAETSFAARNVGGQSSTAPTADALREEMLRKTAEAERTGSFSTKLYGQQAAEPVADNTGILSKAQLAEMARNDVPKTTPLRSQSAAPKRKSSSPDIDDIITKSEANARKKSVSDMSVDDLLKMIESEKNKL